MIRVFFRIAAVAALVPLFLAAPVLAEAQGIGVGVKGGYLRSSFEFDNVADVVDSSDGWMAGLFVGGNRPGTVGAMVEFNILAKKGESGMDTSTVYYFQVPVLLRINGGSKSTTRGVSGYGIVGPAVDL